MIIASVRFRLRPGAARGEVVKAFEAGTKKYRNAPGLVRKHYVYGNGRAGGIYLWESRASAERFYTPEWRAGIARRHGAAPEIEWLDNPVTVDNAAGRVIVDASESGAGDAPGMGAEPETEDKEPPRPPSVRALALRDAGEMAAARAGSKS
jgi:hypothetical protein